VENVLYLIPALGVSYLLGSLPSAYLAGKLKGVDIRKHGSGNMGATNTARILGFQWGLVVLLADILKGFLAAWVAACLLGMWGAVLGGLSVVIAHNWNPWFGFKGGKGVACGLGAALFMIPSAIAVGVIVFVAVVALTRYVSLASLTAALTVLLMTVVFADPTPYKIFAIAAVIFIFIRHIENIKRLYSGTESKFQWKKK